MDNYPTTTILIPSHNPYLVKYPNFKVVSREALHIIKVFRLMGYKVIVTPDSERKLCYVAQKGLQDFFNHPLFINIVGALSISTVKEILKTAYEKFNSRERKPSVDDIIYTILEGDEQKHYNSEGIAITEKAFQAFKEKLVKYQLDYALGVHEIPPDILYPNPVFVEHTGRIVGWAKNIEKNHEGLIMPEIKMNDEKVLAGIKKGTYKGLSIGGLITSSTCSICNQEYVECNHISGQIYDGFDCGVRINAIGMAELSIVKSPANPLARIKIITD